MEPTSERKRTLHFSGRDLNGDNDPPQDLCVFKEKSIIYPSLADSMTNQSFPLAIRTLLPKPVIPSDIDILIPLL